MSYTIVLAADRREANAYAKSAELPRGRWRYPVSAAALRGIRVAEIHELPSWSKRRDRHAVEAELRYARGQRLFIDPRGSLTERQFEVAYRYNALRELAIDDELDEALRLDAMRDELEVILEPEGWEPPDTLTAEQVLQLAANPDARGADILEEPSGEATGASEPSEDPAPAAPRRRRSRCSDCNELDFPETHACPVALRAAAEKPTVLNATTPPVAAPAPIWD